MPTSAVDLAEHCNGLEHLDLEAKNILFNSLIKYVELFSGGLGKATGIKPIHLKLKNDATPYHIKRAFTIPQCYMETTKKEIKPLCQIGVLEKKSDSEWAVVHLSALRKPVTYVFVPISESSTSTSNGKHFQSLK